MRSVVLTRRGRFAVTGSADGTARVWDLFAGCSDAQRSHSGHVSGLIAQNNTVITYGEPLPVSSLRNTHLKVSLRISLKYLMC